VERGEGVVGAHAGLELEAVVVEVFEGLEDFGDVGALGPARELEDAEVVGAGDLGDGVVACEPVEDEGLVGAGDLDVVGIGRDEGLWRVDVRVHGRSLACVGLGSRRKW